MYEIEEVIVNDGEYEETEYLTEEVDKSDSAAKRKELLQKPVKAFAIKEVPEIIPGSGNVGPASAVKKIPIVRKPGEVVTPIHMRISNVKASSTPSQIVGTPTHSKPEWVKVKGLGTKTPLRVPAVVVPTAISKTERPPSPDSDKDNSFDHGYAEVEGVEQEEEFSVAPEQGSNNQLNRIEKKLDQILTKLNQHDSALKILKYNIKDLRIELKNSSRRASEIAPYETQPTPTKRERKRLVVFPVADDNYLERLEELVQADDEIRDEVITLFHEAPTSSIYEYFRKNTASLLNNCSKYTWTGKPTNSLPSMPASLSASKLTLIEILIACACEKFPHVTREHLEKEFRRALSNFNDAKYTKKKRQLEKAVLLGTYDGIM